MPAEAAIATQPSRFVHVEISNCESGLNEMNAQQQRGSATFLNLTIYDCGCPLTENDLILVR
jgi:hypothetical protein